MPILPHDLEVFRKPTLEIVEPVGKRVLIRKDAIRSETDQTGIHLPDRSRSPALGRVVAINRQVERDDDHHRKQIRPRFFNPKHAIR